MPDATDPTTPAGVPGSGLSSAEADRLRTVHGRNEIPAAPPPGLYHRIGAQLSDPLILLLLAAMLVTIVLRDVTDTAVIVLVVVLNTTVGIVQEQRADRAVAALRQLAAPTARVIRDSRSRSLPAAELVPGDLVLLSAGDIVPADLELVRAVRLHLDESALSGESESVAKQEREPVLAGTVVVDGTGAGRVNRIGPDSALGRITALVTAQPRRRTPLQLRLVGLGRALGVAVVGLSAVVMVAGLLRGQPLGEMVLTGVSLTVAAIPESLPAVVTVALALGAYRMARRHAIVRHLPAVETLGSVTLIASDKTGTLTEGRMSCDRVVVAGGRLRLTGIGYQPSGRALDESGRPDPDQSARLARDLVLCNDADLVAPTAEAPQWTPIGDPMEGALLAAAGRLGAAVERRDEFPRLGEIPFDTTRRRMTTLHRHGDAFLLVGKGAPEVMLVGNGPGVEQLRASATQLVRAGYRVLAVADATIGQRPPQSEWETLLAPFSLVALTDPLREGTHELIEGFYRAGIRVAMITGDHPDTALTVAARAGLADRRLATGKDLAERATDAADAGVFARIRPEQKMDLVSAWQQDGQVVAMTGDGVNDAPALRRADIGVAMGRSGTEVARQAADLILADDNLATLGAAVQEGRRIYANIRRFLRYGLSGGLAEVLVMLTGPFLGMPVPLLPAQILWINMLTHGLPGVALGAEPPERDTLDQPPRRPGEAILGAGLAGQVAVTGALITLVSLSVGWWAELTHRPWQTMLFLVLGFAQLWVALAVRSRRVPGSPGNPALYAAVASSALLQLAAVELGPLRTLLGTGSVRLTEVAGCLVVATLPALVLLAGRPAQRWRQSRGRH